MKNYDHPLVWEHFYSFLPAFIREFATEDKAATRIRAETTAQAFLKVSNRLTTEIEPWNTYGNIPILCESYVNTEERWESEAKREGEDLFEWTYKRLLSAEEYQRLVHNIEAAIQAESKAATQPTAAK